jgi:flavin-binding protein dodecin
MAESVYKVIALVGTSNESWEKAAAAAIERASQTLRDLRVARITEQDVHIEPNFVFLAFHGRSIPMDAPPYPCPKLLVTEPLITLIRLALCKLRYFK